MQQNGQASVTVAPRRRGRPPKNATIAQSTSQLPSEPAELKKTESITRAKATTLNRSNSNIDSSTTSKYKSNKLIKNLISKSSSNSNLQKSKVQTTTATTTTVNKPDENDPQGLTATVNPLVNKSNVLLNQNVNTHGLKVNTQSQITGYFVDKVNTSVSEYTALKTAGVSLIKTASQSNVENNQLNSVNQSIYTGNDRHFI